MQSDGGDPAFGPSAKGGLASPSPRTPTSERASRALTMRAKEDLHLLRQIFVGGVRRQPRLGPAPTPEPEVVLTGDGWDVAENGSMRWNKAVPSVGTVVLPIQVENVTQSALTVLAEATPPLSVRWPNGSSETTLAPGQRPLNLEVHYRGTAPRGGVLEGEISLALTSAAGIQRLKAVAVQVALHAGLPFLEVGGWPQGLPAAHSFGTVDPLAGPVAWDLVLRNGGDQELALTIADLPPWVRVGGAGMVPGSERRPEFHLAPGKSSRLTITALADFQSVPPDGPRRLGPREAAIRIATNDARVEMAEWRLALHSCYRVEGPWVTLSPLSPVTVDERGDAWITFTVRNLGSTPARLELDEAVLPGFSAPPGFVPRATADGVPGQARWSVSWSLAAPVGGRQQRALAWRLKPLDKTAAAALAEEAVGAPPGAGSPSENDPAGEVVELGAIGPYPPEGEAPITLAWDWEEIWRQGRETVTLLAPGDEAGQALRVTGPLLGCRLTADPPEIHGEPALCREEGVVAVRLLNTGSAPVEVTAVESNQPWLRAVLDRPSFSLAPNRAGEKGPDGVANGPGVPPLDVVYLPEHLPEGRRHGVVSVHTNRPGLTIRIPVELNVIHPNGSCPGPVAVLLEADNPDLHRWDRRLGAALAAVWDEAASRACPVAEDGRSVSEPIPECLAIRGELPSRRLVMGPAAKGVQALSPGHSANLAAFLSRLGTLETVTVADTEYRADELLGLFLRRIGQWAERALFEQSGRLRYLTIRKALVVTPSDFTEEQRQGTIKALLAAGLTTGPVSEDFPCVMTQSEADAVYLYNRLRADAKTKAYVQALFERGKAADILVCRVTEHRFEAFVVNLAWGGNTVRVTPRPVVIGRELGEGSIRMAILDTVLEECRKKYPMFARELFACPLESLLERSQAENWSPEILAAILATRSFWIQTVEKLAPSLRENQDAQLTIPAEQIKWFNNGNIEFVTTKGRLYVTLPIPREEVEAQIEPFVARCVEVAARALRRAGLAPDQVDFICREGEKSILTERIFWGVDRLFPSPPGGVPTPDPPGSASLEGALRHAAAMSRTPRNYALGSDNRDPWLLFGDSWSVLGVKTDTPWFLGENSSGTLALENRTERTLHVRVRRKGAGLRFGRMESLVLGPRATIAVPFELHFDSATLAEGPFHTVLEMEADLPSQPWLTVPLEGVVVRPAGKSCPQCNKIAAPGEKQCLMCGYSLTKARPLLPEEVFSCPTCGLMFASPSRFCPREGASLVPLKRT